MRPFAPIFLAATLSAASLAAQQSTEWVSIVSGQSGGRAQSAFSDAFHVSSFLEQAGLPPAAISRDSDPDGFADMLAAVAGAPSVLMYHAGRVDGDVLALGAETASLSETLRELADKGTGRVLLMFETCDKRAGELGVVAVPPVPEGLSVSIVTGTDGTGACPPAGARLTDRLASLKSDDLAGQDLVALLDAFDWAGAAPVPVTLGEAVVPPPPVFEAGAAPDADGPLLLPVALPEPDAGFVEPNDGEARIVFAALPATQLAARPLGTGLPEPSIIVGLIEGLNETALEEDVAPETDEQPTIAWNDLSTRRAIRTDSPELFETLVSGGAFDPPQSELVVALQTELTRMECYNRGIDGAWGRGSIAGARRYFETIDEDAPTLDPTFGLFRTFVRRDDVVCPPVAVATVRTPTVKAPSASRSTPKRATAVRRAAPKPASKPVVKKAAPAPKSQKNFGIGIGFR